MFFEVRAEGGETFAVEIEEADIPPAVLARFDGEPRIDLPADWGQLLFALVQRKEAGNRVNLGYRVFWRVDAGRTGVVGECPAAA
jgi:hypothetical protein